MSLPLILGALGIAAYLAYNASSKPAATTAAPAVPGTPKPPGVSDAEWAKAAADLETSLKIPRRNWVPVAAKKPFATPNTLAQQVGINPTIVVFGLQNTSVALTPSGAGGDPVFMGAGGTVQKVAIDSVTKERVWTVGYTHAVGPQVIMVGGTTPTLNVTPWQAPDVGAVFFLKDSDLTAPIV